MKKFLTKFKDGFLKVDNVVDKAQEFFCFVLFFAIVVIGGISVFSRFVFNLSITWAEETIRYLCIWLTWVGAALTVRKDGHVSIDIFISMIKNKYVRAIYYCISRIIGIVFLCILIGPAFQLVAKTKNSMAASIKVSFSYIYLAVPVGIINMLWAYLTALPKYTKQQFENNVTLQDELSGNFIEEQGLQTEEALTEETVQAEEAVKTEVEKGEEK